MKLYSQRNPAWSGHALGWGPALGTIGAYGCYETDFAMIAQDAGFGNDPATMDDFFTAKQIFVRESTGTYDLLPDNALDLAYPGRFHTAAYPGYRADLIAAAVPSADTYAVLFISTASVPTHFVIAWSADGKYIADPWTGAVGTLAGYGGPAAIHKTVLVKALPAPAPPPPVVVPPVVVPPAPPPPPPPPVPYTVLAKGVAIATDVDLAKVLAVAATWQAANPGKELDVWQGQNYVKFLPPDPDLVIPPAPLPVPSQPVTVSDTGLQGLLVLLLNFFLKVTGKR
jgi:hypothetical protein